MKKNSFLSFAVLLFAAAAMITSCSSDEVNNAGPPDKQKKTETVAELTARLKDYGDRLGRNSAAYMRGGADKGNNQLTRADWAKIAIADANGALRGVTVWGKIARAAVCSAIKAAEILTEKRLVAKFSANSLPEVVLTTGGKPVLADSVGYYHNLAEAVIYLRAKDCHTISSAELLSKASDILSTASGGRSYIGEREMFLLEYGVDRIRSIDADNKMSFEAYCAALKAETPADAEHVGFLAEYIYTALYANADMAEYTRNTLFMIENSNLGEQEAAALSGSIRIAYASMMLSQSLVLEPLK